MRIRFVALALVFAFLLVVAGCGGDDGGGGDPKEARALLEDAFDKQVDSAELKLELKAELDGIDQLDDPLSLTMSGPFESNGKKQLPSLDWDIKAEGAGRKLEAGLIVTRDNAFVEYGGQNYEVGRQAFAQLRNSFASQQRSSEGSQSLKQFGIDPATWLKEPELEDGEDIGGDSTRKISGSVDVEKVVRDVLKALKSPALRRQLQSQGQAVPPVPEVKDEDVKKIEDAIEDVRVEVNVDDNDIARRLFAEVKFDIPEGTDAGQLDGGKVSFAFVLEKVGIDPDISGPATARPLSELLGQFGLGGLQLPQQ